ncbi:MAG: hypothetical protein JXA18_16255 [Chitinispirillaceae bacterium]|nr:hypothetical protein [Chitinispirillaceae bacterium]
MLTLYLLSALGITYYILYKDNAPLFPLLFWPTLVAYNWWYSVGSVNLLFGHLFGIACIAWHYRNVRIPLKRRLPIISGFLTLILLCHPMSFLITVSMLMLSELWFLNRPLQVRYVLIAGYVISVIAAALVLNCYFRQPWTPQETIGQFFWLLHDYQPAVETKAFKFALATMVLSWLFLRKDLFRSCIMPAFLLLLTFITPSTVNIAGHNQLRIIQFLILSLPFFVPSPRAALPRTAGSLILAASAAVWIWMQCKKQLHFIGCFMEAETIAAVMPEQPRIHVISRFTSAPCDHAGFYCLYYKGGSITSLYETPFWGVRFDKKYAASIARSTPMSLRSYSHLLFFKDKGNQPGIAGNTVEELRFKNIFTGKWIECYENTEFTGDHPSR